MSSVRAFLAIPLPEQLKDSISAFQQSLHAHWPDSRWIRPENLHLTLHFFFALEQETLEKIKVSVLSVKGCQQPFTVEVEGLGAFPNLHHPRILWLALKPEEQLRQLHSDCRKALSQVGVATESRPYSPHLTIGRRRPGRSNLPALRYSVDHASVGQLHVDRLILFESRLRPDGAEHIPILTMTL
jgi:2'-5' RNA ligase